MKRTLALLLAFCLLFTLPALAAPEDADVLPTLKALDIMVGDDAGNMNLAAPVSRAEFAKLLAASSSYKDSLGGQGSGYSLFTDVKSGHWASEYIKLCLDEGWMIGYTDGSFRPDNTVTLEEACTAALRLLGYDSQSLSGSFPTAQLNKASAVGLREDLDAVRGQELTRQDCALLFYNLLTCKTAQGQVYAVTLGYSLDEDEKVDYLSAVKEELKGPFLCDGGQPQLDFTPSVTYLNDKAVSALTWQTDDVYYYAGGYLWVYRQQVFGQISAVTSSGSAPTAVNVDGKSYTLGCDEVRDQVSALGSQAAGTTVTLLLGMDGQVAALRAVTGPFVAVAGQSLPFTPETVYRDGVVSENAVLAKNDVYYLDESSATLWLCTDRVSGKIQALTPNALSPTAVTISGKSYSLSGDDTRRMLSSLNGKWTDRFVTLLFGLDDSVVGVLTGEAVEADYYGVVQSAAKAAEGGVVEQQVTLFCTDGRTHTFSTGLTHEYEAGDLAQATIANGRATLTPLAVNALNGTVNQGASQVGGYAFADNLEILDTADDGAAVTVEVSALAGLSLNSSNVRFYSLNAAGEIDRLILKDLTGALWSYGFLAELESQGSGMDSSIRYTLLLDGQSRTFQVSNRIFSATEGQAVAVRMAGDSSIGSMHGLSSAELTSLTQTTAYAGNRTFGLSDEVQVYLKDEDDDYHALELSEVTDGGYSLTGYYDTAQKRIRVVIAEEN